MNRMKPNFKNRPRRLVITYRNGVMTAVHQPANCDATSRAQRISAGGWVTAWPYSVDCGYRPTVDLAKLRRSVHH